MSKKYIFRRIRGRIVPILANNKGDIAGAAVIGAVGGIEAGAITAGVKNQKDGKYIARKLKYDNQVDSKKFAKKLNIKVLTSNKDLLKEGLNPNIFTKEAFKGDNAFAFWNRKKKEPVVVTRKMANKTVVAHEIGHALDFKKRKGKISYNALTGSQYETESRAWKIAEKKFGKLDTRLKKRALKTYERNRDYQRIGLGVGSLGAVAGLVIKRAL